jgi:hypothetical protein
MLMGNESKNIFDLPSGSIGWNAVTGKGIDHDHVAVINLFPFHEFHTELGAEAQR